MDLQHIMSYHIKVSYIDLHIPDNKIMCSWNSVDFFFIFDAVFHTFIAWSCWSVRSGSHH